MDGCPPVELGFDPNVASMRQHDVAGDVKTDAGTLRLGLYGVLCAEKLREKLCDVFPGYADARVSHADLDKRLPNLGRDLHDDLPMFDVVANGVLDKVDDDDGKLFSINENLRQVPHSGGRDIS